METRQRVFHSEYDQTVYLIAKETAMITDVEERIDCIMQYVRMCDAQAREVIDLKAELFKAFDEGGVTGRHESKFLKTTKKYKMARGLKKGMTNNPNGRPKGIPNKVTGDLRRAIADLLDGNWHRVQTDLDALDPKIGWHS